MQVMMEGRNNSKLLQPIKSKGDSTRPKRSRAAQNIIPKTFIFFCISQFKKNQGIKTILASSFAYSSSIFHKPLHCLLAVRFTLFTNLLKKFKKIFHPKMEQDITKFLTQRHLAFRKIRTLERVSHFANLYYSMKSVPRTPRYFDLTEITFP